LRKTISMFQTLSDAEEPEEKEKYETFWKSYGVNIKLGIIEDTNNRSRLAKLLRYMSTTGNETSLDDYVSRMKEGQNDIYYLAGESVDALKASPLLEKLVDRGYEVLLMTDPIDEYTIQNLPKYDKKYKLTNLGKEGVKLPEDKDQDDESDDHEENLKDVIDYLKSTFSDKIARVKVSDRLSRSPCALVAESWGYTAQMERAMKAQALSNPQDKKMWIGRKVLELNPKHPIVLELNRLVQADEEPAKAKDVAQLLIDTAAISSGYSIDQPNEFVARVHRMISLSLDLDEGTPAPATRTFSKEEEDHDEL